MNPLTAIREGARLKAANDLKFPQFGGWWTVTPRATIDLRKAGDGLSNSATAAVVRSLGTAFSEPPIREYRRVESQWEEVEDSSAAELVNNPNPWMESELLAKYEVAAIATTGSAYFHIVRNALDDPVALYPLYPQFMEPKTDNANVLQTHWRYTVPGGQAVNIPMEDIVHRRWDVDRNDHRRGWAPLKDVLLEVLQDQEAAMFSTALLTNMGVPGVVLSPKDPNDPGPSDPAKVAQAFQSKFTGANRGQPFVANNALQVDMVSFNPDQMDLTSLRRVPEERITAALGWPAILAGLGAGLTATSGKGEANTLRENATESKLVPEWRLAGKQWTRQLLWQDAYGGVDPSKELRYDLSDVRALQQDETDLVSRMDVGIKGGWISVAEGRRAAGLPIEEQHEVFLRSVSVEAVGVDQDALIVDDIPV